MSERNQPIISGIEGVVTIHSDVDATTSAILLNNWTANVAPTVTDDSNAGYAIGSEWTDLTADKSYKLVDATVGAAVWKEITAAGGGGGDVATDPIWDVEGDLVVATGNDAATRIPIGSAGTFLRSDATTADWSTTSFPNSAGTGDLIVATSANNYDNLNPGAVGDVLTSNGAGVQPSYQTPLPNVFTPTINSTNMVEVSQESDFGTAVGGVITPAANTAYFVRGNVNCTNILNITNPNIAIIGWDRDVDGLTYTGAAGAGDFITVTDVNFQLANLKLSSTNSTGGDVVLRAVNYNQPDYNAGRNKVLTIVNCQFRNCFDVWNIEGFDLVDIQNTLVWYIEATTIGCQFKNVSKLQISSCEYVRWFDETNITNSLGAWDAGTSYTLGDIVTEGPTFYRALTNNLNRQPSTTIGVDWETVGYATASMIELLDNGGGNGFGAININGAIIHPQQTQVGIEINPASTTGFGTISSSAFINIGLTTGKVFLPEIPVLLLPDYSQTATYKFDVFANQGLINSVSGVVSTLSANATATTLTGSAYADVDTGGSSTTQAAVRFTTAGTGIVTYDGTKQIYCSIHASLSLNSGGNDDTYTVGLFKDSGGVPVLLPGSEVEVQFDSGGSVTLDVGSIAINYGTLFNNGDSVRMGIKSTGVSASITVTDYQLVIRE
jgi:hypothetical protein